MVFEIFDQEDTGLLDYPEFVYAIHGEVFTYRQKLIDRVFEKMQLPSHYFTSFNEIKRIFKARNHLNIKNGRKFG
jgi:Ca2+-binding EF-hand superfamily protein